MRIACMFMHMHMVVRKYMPMNNQAQLVTSAYHQGTP